jgi:hypothetical protein
MARGEIPWPPGAVRRGKGQNSGITRGCQESDRYLYLRSGGGLHGAAVLSGLLADYGIAMPAGAISVFLIKLGATTCLCIGAAAGLGRPSRG